MLAAIEECQDTLEEEGGVIINKLDDYEFVKLKNRYTGTYKACGLYHADDDELRDKVFSRIKDGWRFHSSFHTHPQFPATPSSLDTGTLFDGFKYNIIYSIEKKAFSYSEWVDNEIVTCYLPLKTVQNAAYQS